MSKIKWTPGPWVVGVDEDSEVAGYPLVTSLDYQIIGSEGMFGDIQTDFANAHLIAAAPELYEALENALEVMVWDWGGEPLNAQPAIDKARAALAKARGES